MFRARHSLSNSLKTLLKKPSYFSSWANSPQTIVITGGSGGIGLGIAKKLASQCEERTVNFVLVSQHMERLLNGRQKIVEETGYPIDKIQLMETDLSKLDETLALNEKLSNLENPVKLLVNCAGTNKSALLSLCSADIITHMVNVNLVSVALLCKGVVQQMTKSGGGSIINIASVNAVSGVPGQSIYSATKSGVIGLTKSLAKEVGSKNIRVNSISPGFILTDMTSVLSDTQKKIYLDKIPIKRFGQPDDIGEAVLSILNAKYITGQNIIVDGGMLC